MEKQPDLYRFDPRERAREKQEARDREEAGLRDGEVDAGQLRKEVGFFSCLDVSRAKVNRRPDRRPLRDR